MAEALLDKRGVQIEPGDLLKSFHYRDRRRRRYWLYHVAVRDEKRLRAVPVSHLEPSCRRGGGDPLLTPSLAADMEIIHGHGPGECLYCTDRPRAKAVL